MVYIWCFNDDIVQVDDYIDQIALQAAMNDLQLGSFKWKISKRMPNTFSGLME